MATAYRFHSIEPEGLWTSESFPAAERRHIVQGVIAGFLSGHPRWATTLDDIFIYGLDAKGKEMKSAPSYHATTKTTRHHVTKKSPAQLQREIDKVLASPEQQHHVTKSQATRKRAPIRVGGVTYTVQPRNLWRTWDFPTLSDAVDFGHTLQEPFDVSTNSGAIVWTWEQRESHATRAPGRGAHTLSPEQLRALHAFANANGTQWKSKLNVAWSTGRYDDYPGTDEHGDLQQVRNTFGPAWLTKFSFSNVKTHSVKR